MFSALVRVTAAMRLAGEGLCKMLRRSGGEGRALQLCQEVTGRALAARWAWNQLGRLLLRSGQAPQVCRTPDARPACGTQGCKLADVKCRALWLVVDISGLTAYGLQPVR